MKTPRPGVAAIAVERLQFEFDDSWADAVHWDDTAAYRGGIGRLPDVAAVDLICLRRQGLCLLMEVKDFRGHRIENKNRLTNGELILEVARKVAGTLAGLVGASRMDGESERWRLFSRALIERKSDVRVVLWLEEDFMPPSGGGTAEERWRARLGNLQAQLKQRLRWLTPHVLVASSRMGTPLPGIRGGPAREALPRGRGPGQGKGSRSR